MQIFSKDFENPHKKKVRQRHIAGELFSTKSFSPLNDFYNISFSAINDFAIFSFSAVNSVGHTHQPNWQFFTYWKFH